MAQVKTRKRGKTFSYIFEAGKVDGKRKVVEKGGFATRDAVYKAGVAAYNIDVGRYRFHKEKHFHTQANCLYLQSW